MTVVEELQDFFTVADQAGNLQKVAGRVTDHYDFGFGAIKMPLNTLPTAPNDAPPPLSWDLVMWIGSQFLQMDEFGMDGTFRGGVCGSYGECADFRDTAGGVGGPGDDWMAV
ncbi:MAG: hypothetical protein Q9175_007323 [Cornicularia normoerica]